MSGVLFASGRRTLATELPWFALPLEPLPLPAASVLALSPTICLQPSPRADHQPLTETYVNMPTTAQCNMDSPLDPKEIKKEEQANAEKAVTKEEFQGEWTSPTPKFTAAQPEVTDWFDGMKVPAVPIQQPPTEDWSPQPATKGRSTAPTAQATRWVGTTTEWS
ncbi:hypothetical protein MC885_016694 [Smutsia gigantea]|nr:hypothetical protein MC885_016694 [Smutsia gigantea]